jgi:hypothetical protein
VVSDLQIISNHDLIFSPLVLQKLSVSVSQQMSSHPPMRFPDGASGRSQPSRWRRQGEACSGICDRRGDYRLVIPTAPRPVERHLPLSPSRKEMASSSTRTASSIGITGRASKTKAGNKSLLLTRERMAVPHTLPQSRHGRATAASTRQERRRRPCIEYSHTSIPAAISPARKMVGGSATSEPSTKEKPLETKKITTTHQSMSGLFTTGFQVTVRLQAKFEPMKLDYR